MQKLELESLESACNKIEQLPVVRFTGVLNKAGNLIARGFKKDVIRYVSDGINKKAAKDLSVREKFDESLGPVEYVAAKRKKVTKITIPYQDHLIVISAEPYADAEQVAQLALRIFRSG